MAASLDHVGLQVTPDNVLAVRRALLQEAERLQSELEKHGRDVTVRRCGEDPVSADAAAAFTPRLQAMVRQAMLVPAMLRAAGDRLGEAARAYGHTDAEIAASFATNPTLTA
jgi:hypothetical protein